MASLSPPEGARTPPRTARTGRRSHTCAAPLFPRRPQRQRGSAMGLVPIARQGLLQGASVPWGGLRSASGVGASRETESDEGLPAELGVGSKAKTMHAGRPPLGDGDGPRVPPRGPGGCPCHAFLVGLETP